jgi:predicted DNA-binding transcriptional regulator YafY
MPGRNAQISRVIQELLILEGAPQGLTVKDLCARLADRGYTEKPRTVYRDLEMLGELGLAFPPEEGKTDEGAARWKLGNHTRITDSFFLSPKELLALYLARGVLAPLRETYFYEDLQSIFRKIEDRLSERTCRHLHELSSEFHFEPGPRWGLGIEPDVLETVRAACAERQWLEVTYFSANRGEKSSRKLGPHFLYSAKGSLYLVAEDRDAGIAKVFSVPRMSEARLLDEPYEGKVTDPESYFQGSFGVFVDGHPERIRIEFSPLVSPFVRERRWHSSQTVVAKSNGVIQLSLEVSLTPELVQWILGFGSTAKELEPESLKERIVEEANRILSPPTTPATSPPTTYHSRKAA